MSLIIKRIRVKALVKDKRAAIESFGTYVEVSEFTFSNAINVVYFDLHNIQFWFMFEVDNWRSKGFFFLKEIPERCPCNYLSQCMIF